MWTMCSRVRSVSLQSWLAGGQDVANGFDDGVGGFLGQVVAGGGDQAALVRAAEVGRGPVGGARGIDTVVDAVQVDGGDGDRRLGGQLSFDWLQGRVAGGVAVAVAVGLDDHVDEVGIVEGGGAARVGLVGELPGGRPQAPDQAAQLEAIGSQASPAALGMEVVLVPQAVLLFGRRGLGGAGDVLDVVAVDGDQGAGALGP